MAVKHLNTRHCLKTENYMYHQVWSRHLDLLLSFTLSTQTKLSDPACDMTSDHLKFKSRSRINPSSHVQLTMTVSIRSSGVPRILEWEGSRSYGLRGGGYGEGYPLPTEGRVWGGGCPRKFSVFFVENTIFWRILTRLFLKPYANGRGSNPPNPLLGTPLIRSAD